MMPTAIIAEDERLLAASLHTELGIHWPELKVVAVVDNGAAALMQAMALRPTVCFLDINMPGMSGLEAAAAMADDWPLGVPFPLIVFVTAYDEHAARAFDMQAVDYLVKPVSPKRLSVCIERLRSRVKDRTADIQAFENAMQQLRHAMLTHGTLSGPKLSVIQASIANVVHMVPVEDVIYFEAADKYVRVVTQQRDFLVRTSLKELLPQLESSHFWQVHRSLVVRATSIVTAELQPSGKVTLSLRGRSEKLTASRLYAHLFRGM